MHTNITTQTKTNVPSWERVRSDDELHSFLMTRAESLGVIDDDDFEFAAL